jgi:hypothetical protein
VCTRRKETKIVSLNRYIRFVEISSGLIKESRIPLYSSNFSKKDLQSAPVVNPDPVEGVLVR